MAVIYLTSCSEDTNLISENKSSDQSGLIDLIKQQVNEDKKFETKIKKKIGEINWETYLFESDDISKKSYFIFPLISNKRDLTNGLMFAFVDDSNDVKFIFSEEKMLHKLQPKIIKKEGIPLETVLLSYMHFDQILFDRIDCNHAQIAESLWDSFEIFKQNKDYYCTSVTYYTETDWYQCDNTGNCTYLDTQVSIDRVETDCTFIPTSGGNTSSGQTSDELPTLGGTTGSYEDENIIDNTSTPCVKEMIALIKDQSFASDLFVQVLRDIFDVTDNVNITIVEEYIGSKDGDFTYTQNQVVSGLNYHYFEGILFINNRYTSQATKDWILATLIHEMIHGYIDYQEKRLENDLISQEDFDEKFPLFSEDDTHHTTMGFRYVEVISNILMEANPNLASFEALALARAGLQGNSYWNTLSYEEKQNSSKYNDIGRGEFQDTSSKQIKC